MPATFSGRTILRSTAPAPALQAAGGADFRPSENRYPRRGIRAGKIEAVRRKYPLPQDIERGLQWMGPLLELPERLG